MTFKNYQQKQSFLLPPSFSDFLGESHEAVILGEFIQELNTSDLEQSYHNQNGGSSAYHPVMLISILIYGYMNGIFSSRQLAKQLKQNLAFMYLAGNTKPDFRTLSRFRKEKGAYLESIFNAVVRRAQDLGLINFGTCCLDGTKIYANASTSNNQIQEKLSEKISKLIEKAEEIDQLEDAEFGDEEDGEISELKTKEGRAKKKQELTKQRKKAEIKLEKLTALNPLNEETRLNLTDQDSKLMKMKRNDFANGYNVQIISENGVILNNAIFNSPADTDTLIPSLQKLQGAFEKPKILLADKGYSSEDNYLFCEQNNIDAYIPALAEQKNLEDYHYDAKKDTYTDKQGTIYYFKQHMRRRGDKVKYKLAESPQSRRHLFKMTVYEGVDERTNKKKYLSISSGWQKYIKQQKEKLSTNQGKEIYKQRGYDVEGVFANIKKNLRFTSFNLRGFSGVAAEWTLISLAHNLKKIL